MFHFFSPRYVLLVSCLQCVKFSYICHCPWTCLFSFCSLTYIFHYQNFLTLFVYYFYLHFHVINNFIPFLQLFLLLGCLFATFIVVALFCFLGVLLFCFIWLFLGDLLIHSNCLCVCVWIFFFFLISWSEFSSFFLKDFYYLHVIDLKVFCLVLQPFWST